MIKKERLDMVRRARQGFTLIEILIVVAIIAILATIVVVDLGPAQQSGRDARRLSDIQSIRNAVQFFYQKCGFYPGTAASGCTGGSPGATWANFQSSLAADGVGVNSASDIPVDPSANRSYGYGVSSDNTAFVLAAVLENSGNSVLTTYNPPTGTSGYTWSVDSSKSVKPDTSCAAPTYCISL